jgi:hypothetical protein
VVGRLTRNVAPRRAGTQIPLALQTLVARELTADERFGALKHGPRVAALVAVANFMNRDGTWFHKRETWRECYGASKSSHDRYVRDLDDAGIVQRIPWHRPRATGGLTQTSNTYQLDPAILERAEAEYARLFPSEVQLPARGEPDKDPRRRGGGQGSPSAESHNRGSKRGSLTQSAAPEPPRGDAETVRALIEHFGEPTNDDERGRRNRAIKLISQSLAKTGMDEGDAAAAIAIAVSRWPHRYPGAALTDKALASHWSELAPRTLPTPPCEECGVGGGRHAGDCSKATAA